MKWDKIKQELLKGVFEKNSGCLVAGTKDFFEENDISRSADSVLEVDSNQSFSGKTFILHKKQWTPAELENIATSYQFELANLWMRPDLDANTAAKDSNNFWNVIDEINSPSNHNFDVPESPIQTIGCLGDGDWIFWTNPTPDKFDMVLENMKMLFLKLDIGMKD